MFQVDFIIIMNILAQDNKDEYFNKRQNIIKGKEIINN